MPSLSVCVKRGGKKPLLLLFDLTSNAADGSGVVVFIPTCPNAIVERNIENKRCKNYCLIIFFIYIKMILQRSFNIYILFMILNSFFNINI